MLNQNIFDDNCLDIKKKCYEKEASQVAKIKLKQGWEQEFICLIPSSHWMVV